MRQSVQPLCGARARAPRISARVVCAPRNLGADARAPRISRGPCPAPRMPKRRGRRHGAGLYAYPAINGTHVSCSETTQGAGSRGVPGRDAYGRASGRPGGMSVGRGPGDCPGRHGRGGTAPYPECRTWRALPTVACGAGFAGFAGAQAVHPRSGQRPGWPHAGFSRSPLALHRNFGLASSHIRRWMSKSIHVVLCCAGTCPRRPVRIRSWRVP